MRNSMQLVQHLRHLLSLIIELVIYTGVEVIQLLPTAKGNYFDTTSMVIPFRNFSNSSHYRNASWMKDTPLLRGCLLQTLIQRMQRLLFSDGISPESNSILLQGSNLSTDGTHNTPNCGSKGKMGRFRHISRTNWKQTNCHQHRPSILGSYKGKWQANGRLTILSQIV